MSPENTMELILGVAGVILQLVYKFVPFIKNWLEGFEFKGLVILGVDAVVAVALGLLACSAWAGQLGISLVCDASLPFLLLKAFVAIMLAQQGAYLVTRRAK